MYNNNNNNNNFDASNDNDNDNRRAKCLLRSYNGVCKRMGHNVTRSAVESVSLSGLTWTAMVRMDATKTSDVFVPGDTVYTFSSSPAATLDENSTAKVLVVVLKKKSNKFFAYARPACEVFEKLPLSEANECILNFAVVCEASVGKKVKRCPEADYVECYKITPRRDSGIFIWVDKALCSIPSTDTQLEQQQQQQALAQQYNGYNGYNGYNSYYYYYYLQSPEQFYMVAVPNDVYKCLASVTPLYDDILGLVPTNF